MKVWQTFDFELLTSYTFKDALTAGGQFVFVETAFYVQVKTGYKIIRNIS